MAIEPSTVGAEGAPLAGQDAPLISVIIPHYNDLAILERCMGLLAAQTLPRSQFEVVVADNNSRCGLNEVKRVCGGTARVVPAPFQRAGAARNAAVEAPRGRVLAFINSDCRPTPAWLERGLAALSSAQIVGGQVDVDYEDPAHPTAVEAFERVFAFNFKRYIEKLGFSGSGNMFVPREIFDRVGCFRGQVAEDLDWGQRAIAANYRFDEVVVSIRRDGFGASLPRNGGNPRAKRLPRLSRSRMDAPCGFSGVSLSSLRHSSTRSRSSVQTSWTVRGSG